jgi:hypothetical protein
VRPSIRRDPAHPDVFDTDLLLEKSYLLSESIALGPETDLGAERVGSPSTDRGHGVASQGDGMEDRGADMSWPAARQGQVEVVTVTGHGSLPDDPVRCSGEA